VEWLVKIWPAATDRSEALQLAGRLLEEAVIVPAKEATEAKPAFVLALLLIVPPVCGGVRVVAWVR
jgi:hypothetical protein